MATQAEKPQIYSWEGLNKRGTRVKGESTGLSASIVQAELQRQGINTLRIRKKAKPLFSFGAKKIGPLDIVIFTRHLSTMILAGLPLVQSLDIIARGQENPNMQKLVLDVKTDVASGKTFSDSLSKHPRYFDDLFVSLINAGEQSGTLDTMLNRIAIYLEKSHSLKKKIKKAFVYPAAVLVVAMCVSAVLLLFVVPQFDKLFSSFGAELPAFTRVIVVLSEFLRAYWWMLLIAIGGFIYMLVRLKRNSKRFTELLDRRILKGLGVGPLLKNAIIARYARTLATTMAAGIPVIESLQAVADTAGNSVYSKAIIQIKEDVATGLQMHTAMTTTQLFPNMVVQMVAVGEESGSIEDMLNKIATYYEEDVDNMVDNLSSLLEPLIMVVLGGIIGSFVIAMYLPIFKIGSIF